MGNFTVPVMTPSTRVSRGGLGRVRESFVRAETRKGP